MLFVAIHFGNRGRSARVRKAQQHLKIPSPFFKPEDIEAFIKEGRSLTDIILLHLPEKI